MSLDTWITKKVLINDAIREDLKNSKEIQKLNLDVYQIRWLEVKLVDWHNDYPIHEWFVDTIQSEDDCGIYYIPKESLCELLDLVKEVEDDHAKAAELLPDDSGYDARYFQMLHDTNEKLSYILEQEDDGFYYYSSW